MKVLVRSLGSLKKQAFSAGLPDGQGGHLFSARLQKLVTGSVSPWNMRNYPRQTDTYVNVNLASFNPER